MCVTIWEKIILFSSHCEDGVALTNSSKSQNFSHISLFNPGKKFQLFEYDVSFFSYGVPWFMRLLLLMLVIMGPMFCQLSFWQFNCNMPKQICELVPHQRNEIYVASVKMPLFFISGPIVKLVCFAAFSTLRARLL